MADSAPGRQTAFMHSISSLRGVDGLLMVFVLAVVTVIALGALGLL